jgi:hypothetical protein
MIGVIFDMIGQDDAGIDLVMIVMVVVVVVMLVLV